MRSVADAAELDSVLGERLGVGCGDVWAGMVGVGLGVARGDGEGVGSGVTAGVGVASGVLGGVAATLGSTESDGGVGASAGETAGDGEAGAGLASGETAALGKGHDSAALIGVPGLKRSTPTHAAAERQKVVRPGSRSNANATSATARHSQRKLRRRDAARIEWRRRSLVV